MSFNENGEWVIDDPGNLPPATQQYNNISPTSPPPIAGQSGHYEQAGGTDTGSTDFNLVWVPDSTSSGNAWERQGALIRADYQDWLTRFAPFEDLLGNLATHGKLANTTLRNDIMRYASKTADDAAGRAMSNVDRNTRLSGLNLTNSQKASLQGQIANRQQAVKADQRTSAFNFLNRLEEGMMTGTTNAQTEFKNRLSGLK